MGININDLDNSWNLQRSSLSPSGNTPTDNLRELSEQELEISGGMGNVSILVTDDDGSTILEDEITFETGTVVFGNNIKVFGDDVTVYKTNKLFKPLSLSKITINIDNSSSSSSSD